METKETCFVKKTEFLTPGGGLSEVRTERTFIVEVSVFPGQDAAEAARDDAIGVEYAAGRGQQVTRGRSETAYRLTEPSTGFVWYYKFEEI